MFCSQGNGADAAQTLQPPLSPPACQSSPGSPRQGQSHPPITSLWGQSPGRDGCSKTHPCLIDRVVELRFYRDLAVWVGVHEGQAEAGVVPTPAGGGHGSHWAVRQDPRAKHGQPCPPVSPHPGSPCPPGTPEQTLMLAPQNHAQGMWPARAQRC